MQKIFTGLMLIVLSGCSIYKTDFDCPIKNGLSCKTMSQVHKMVENGEVKEDEESGEFKVIKKTKEEQKEELKVWFSSYKDGDGKTHEEKYVKYLGDPK